LCEKLLLNAFKALDGSASEAYGLCLCMMVLYGPDQF